MKTDMQYPLGQMATKDINPVWILHGYETCSDVFCNGVFNIAISVIPLWCWAVISMVTERKEKLRRYYLLNLILRAGGAGKPLFGCILYAGSGHI